MAKTVSDNTFTFLKACYERAVVDLLDDPVCACGGGSDGPRALQSLARHYNTLSVAGAEVGMPFWQVACREGASHEITRLVGMLTRAGVEVSIASSSPPSQPQPVAVAAAASERP